MTRGTETETAIELAEEIERFCKNNEVELFILFGSHARGAFHLLSDVDIALQFPPNRQPSKLQLIHELEMIWMPKTVDLVILTPETDPLLLNEIFTRGKLLHEKSEGLFERAKLRAWHLYLDTAALRQKEREYLRNKSKDPTDVT